MTLFPRTPWRDMMQDVARNIDDHCGGEVLYFQPMTRKPNMSPVPDGARPTFKAVGLFHLRSLVAMVGMEEVGVQTRKPWASIRYEQLHGRSVKNGDRLTVERTGLIYEVRDQLPDGVSATRFDLVQIGRAPVQ